MDLLCEYVFYELENDAPGTEVEKPRSCNHGHTFSPLVTWPKTYPTF